MQTVIESKESAWSSLCVYACEIKGDNDYEKCDFHMWNCFYESNYYISWIYSNKNKYTR